MKNNGQKFNTSKKIQSYVNNNIEELYKNRDRTIDYVQLKRGAINESKDLDLIDPALLTGRQKNLLAKDK